MIAVIALFAVLGIGVAAQNHDEKPEVLEVHVHQDPVRVEVRYDSPKPEYCPGQYFGQECVHGGFIEVPNTSTESEGEIQ